MKHIKKFNEEYMYTFNYLCFGHDLSKDKNLNNSLRDYDVEFNTIINGKEYQIDFPYHGGQVSGDCYSCVFGTIISDDDNNPSYIRDIRNAKESDYINDYNKFIDILIKELDEDVKNASVHEKELYIDLVNDLKKFLKSNNPEFYSVEASS